MATLEISVREAQPEDAPLLAALCAQLGYRASLGDIRQKLPEILGRDDTWLAVAMGEGQRVVGWMQVCEQLSLVDGGSAHLAGLVVDERFRRAGIGKMLVDAAMGWAAERGCERLRVRSNAARKEAHDFYPSLGFKLQKTQRCYVKELGKGVRSSGCG